MTREIQKAEKERVVRRAFRAAFPHTIPIFAGFWFLGLTYGIYMNVSGYSFIYPMLMSVTIFAGSMEFVAVNLLLGAFSPLQAFAMTLMINARHLFSVSPCWKNTADMDGNPSISSSGCVTKAFPSTIRLMFRGM